MIGIFNHMIGSFDSTPPSCKALLAHLGFQHSGSVLAPHCNAPKDEGAATRNFPGDGHQCRHLVFFRLTKIMQQQTHIEKKLTSWNDPVGISLRKFHHIHELV